MNRIFLKNSCKGRFFCTENGRNPGLRYSFVRGCMLGLHLLLPRTLAARAVCATLGADNGTDLTLPLTLVRTEGGWEEYATLVDTGDLPVVDTLFFLSFSLVCRAGRLHATQLLGEELLFSEGEGAVLPLLLTEGRERLLPIGGVYVLSYAQLAHTGALCHGKDGDYDRFFAHLAAHGVHTLLLPLPPSDRKACQHALTLPVALTEAAQEHGVCCLFDLFPFLIQNRAEEDFSQAQELSLCDEEPFGGSAELSPPLSPHLLCGEAGILSRALSGGYRGIFLRHADRFGDPLLGMLRKTLVAYAPDALFLACSSSPDVDGIAFGRRRRFFGGTLDGLVSYTLRDALLAYLLHGEVKSLSQYLGRTLAAMPAPRSFLPVHPLCGEGGESFLSLLSQDGRGDVRSDKLSALSELAELIAATLPGAPVLSRDGVGEDTLAFRLRLFGMYRREKTLAEGDFRLHTITPELLLFSRAREGEMLLTLINRSADILSVSSQEGFSVLLGGRGRKHLFRLPPYSGTVLRIGLYSGERGGISLRRQPVVSHNTRFAPRVLEHAEKSS